MYGSRIKVLDQEPQTRNTYYFPESASATQQIKTAEVALDNEMHELESLLVCFCSTLPRCNRQSQHHHGTLSGWKYASLLTIFRQYG